MTRVPTKQVSDPHLDAKIFPCAHPYGTGSVQSEGTSVQPFRVCRSRLLTLQSFFRRSSRYAFWMLDMSIKRQLFFNNLCRRRCGPSSAGPADADRFTQVYGSIVPHSIPESTSWWKLQKFELAAICDDAEAGFALTIALFSLSLWGVLILICPFQTLFHAHILRSA